MGDKPPSTIKELVKAMTDLSAQFDSKQSELKQDLKHVIESEMESVKTSMGFINEKFEEFRTEISELKKTLSDVKNVNQEMKKENNRLTNEVKTLRHELTELQQYSRRNNLEIKGIPPAPSENLISVMTSICHLLSTEFDESDVEAIHRVPSKNKDEPNIIVKFASRKVRDSILKKAKKQRLNTTLLSFDDHENPVFINEHLCPAIKILLGKARKAKKEKQWKHTWVSDGKILMRKTDTSHVLHITCDADLAQVV